MNCTIGLVQFSVDADQDMAILRAEQKIRDAAENGAQIICLPELFSTPYFPQHIGIESACYAQPRDGPFLRRFLHLASELERVIIVPFCERGGDGRIYNSAVVIDADGTPFPPYHKIHLPQDPGFYEKGHFVPGNEYHVYTTRYGTIAVLICFDQWFPEAARIVARKGAEIIFYPTALGHMRGEIPAEGDWRDAWQIIQQSHAIANSVPIAAVNRCGWEGRIFFFGCSFVCDAFGKIIQRADADEAVLIAEVDLSQGPAIREGWGFFRNRRPDTYQDLAVTGNVLPHDIQTPAQRGYHMPAEWEPHDAVWLAWPHNDLTFPHLAAVEETYLKIISSLQNEPIKLLIPNLAYKEKVTHLLSLKGIQSDSLQFFSVPYSDVWIRDYGPIFVTNRALHESAAVFWEFNAWGNKYDEPLLDGIKTRGLFETFSMLIFRPGIILEGGSIDTNGRGTLLTTKQCLLNKNRNPQLSPEEIEQYLCSYLGVEKIIWLEKGIAGDDTDGHIDDIARFVNPTTIVCAVENNPEDDNYELLRENFMILSSATDQDDNPLTVVPIPMPCPVMDDSLRYPASYLNFYIGNHVVLVPTFEDVHDQRVLAIFRDLFPDRTVIGISARKMVEGFGTIHCATQQQPSA